MRIGILDIIALPSQSVGKNIYHLMISKQLANITPQIVSVWCRQLGHETFYTTYYGLGKPEDLLPDDLDIIFIACYTQASALAYALAKLYRKKGVQTVIGGSHAKAFPQDCLRFFDIVVKECDKNLIADILAGRFKPGSFVSSLQPFKTLPTVEERMPEIYKSAFWWGKKRYYLTSAPMLTSAGCPYTCDFCSEWNNDYYLFDPDRLLTDLKYIAHNHPGMLLQFQDPNFGVKFDQVLNTLEEIPLALRSPYVSQSSLTILRQTERLERMKNTNCVAIAPSIESWDNYSVKADAGRKVGIEKLKKVVEHFNLLYQYFPYGQANFIFGLDTDKGDDPINLTKLFIDQVPFYWHSVNIPVPFGGTPLFDEYFANGRILQTIPFSFYYDPYLVITIKHYDPIAYYKKLIELSTYITGKAMLNRRLKSTPEWKIKVIHWLRTLSAGQNLPKYQQILNHLQSDPHFLAFHQGQSKELPAFYHQEYERMLGRYTELLSPADRYPELGQLEPITN